MKPIFDIHNNFVVNSIHNKILVPMLLLSLIPIIVFGVVFLNNTYDDLEDKKILELQNTLELKNDKLKIIFEGIEREIKFIVSDTSFSNDEFITSENKIELNNKYRDRLEFFINSQPMIDGVRIVNQFDNYYLYYDSIHVDNENYAEFLANVYKSGLSSTYFSKAFVDETGNRQMYVAYPINEGGLDSIFLIELNLKYIYSIIQDQSGIENSEEILLGQKVENKAEFLHDLKHESSEIYSPSIFLTEKRALPIREAVQGISGCGSTVDYRFEPITACWGPTAFLDWGIVAKIDQKDVFESVNSNIILFLITISSTLLLIVVISYLVARGIQNPILELKNTFKEFNGGKYDSVVKIKGHDEISDLTKSFQTFQEYFSANNKIKNFYQKELEKKLSELKKTDVLKDEFASMVTHELKTPLTPIRGYCEMLKENSLGTLTPEQLDCIEIIDSNAFHLEKLIGDILDAQKLDMGRMVFNKNNLNVGPFLTELMKSIQPMMLKKQITLTVLPMVENMVFSDEQRLKQIFTNLIRNATDFVSDKTGIIEIGVLDDKKHVTFFVKDNGIGIPKSKQSNIFKKFYQVNTAQTRKHGGTGIGLVICKGIVEGLEGKIWFESVENQGTTFYFSIPKPSSISVEAKQ